MWPATIFFWDLSSQCLLCSAIFDDQYQSKLKSGSFSLLGWEDVQVLHWEGHEVQLPLWRIKPFPHYKQVVTISPEHLLQLERQGTHDPAELAPYPSWQVVHLDELEQT